MRIQKNYIPPFVITIVLFFIPFFWLKPGEMDLGGDSSRLYFYDPFAYLHAEGLYSVISSGVGGDAIHFYSIPHMLLLAILRLVIAPTILISIYNGIKLSVAFLSCYLIVKELIKTKEFAYRQGVVEISAIIGGIFYLLSPVLVNSGWDRAILTHTQVFINPLMFLLLLQYFVTRNVGYLLGALIITFIFSLNFSFIGAPSFFAFYPLSFLFLFIYTKYIKKTKIPVKQLLVGGLAFFLLQAFHIVPHILSLFSAGSEYAGLFTDQTKITRGLDYFTAIAPNIKVNISLLNLAQVRDIVFLSLGFIIFPAIILIGFLLNSTKRYSLSKYTFPLSGVFFLITLFFASANITDIGFAFYKLLFYIPGFQMFRNFYGQWAFAFIFFYTLLSSQCLAIVLNQLKRYKAYLLTLYIVLVLIITAWPFINGSMVNAIHFQSKAVKQNIQMDPLYEKVLNFVRTLPIDGKILSLPLVGPGYQVLAGKEGGAYIGPSTFSYLLGKSDFTGYDGLKPYGDFFLQSIRDKNYSSLQKLFSLLNIKYIFYNSDTYIYDDNFPFYPYNYITSFLPNKQKLYKEFINQLPIDKDKKIDIGDKYHFYAMKDNEFLPHIYTTNNITYTNVFDMLSFIPYFNDSLRSAVFYIANSKNTLDNIILQAENNDPPFILKNNYHLHIHKPFVSVRLDDIKYRFVLLKEKFKLWEARNNHDQYMDFSLLYLSKRIGELDKWGENVLITKKRWKEPKIWEIYKWKQYNSWEVSLSRYQLGMEQLINWLAKSGKLPSWQGADKIKINEQLNQHQFWLIKLIKKSNKVKKEKLYLLSLVNDTFEKLFSKLDLDLYNDSILRYSLSLPRQHRGEYETYVDTKEIHASLDYVEIDGKLVKPVKNISGSNLLQLENVFLKNKDKINNNIDLVLHVSKKNLLETSYWQNSGNSNGSTTAAELTINNSIGDSSGGLVHEIPNWLPRRQYLISFDYQSFGDYFTFALYDKKYKYEDKSELAATLFFEKNLNSRKWKTQQSIITADADSVSAFVQILGNSEKPVSRIKIKNFYIAELPDYKIFFKKVRSDTKRHVLPKIKFTKINPTKYRIEVRGASNPYTLVFLEQFSEKWKLQDISKNTNSFKGAISRFFGKVGIIMMSPFIKDKRIENNIVASYFDGSVKEGVHQKTFLAPSTFETWGKDPVADNKHFRANGYANGWSIEPKDMNGKTNYTLILEMTAQKKLYPLLFVSFFTFFSVLSYFFVKLFNK